MANAIPFIVITLMDLWHFFHTNNIVKVNTVIFVFCFQKGHQLALSLITYIGISISIVALCLAFLTFHFFR